ncbi:MAG TPA: transglutaminase domain-containing protein [Solirubrobacteraceae bacterium]|nr:transglutaminase domain-containing protein [Solirubrobacteraceae bacterium]
MSAAATLSRRVSAPPASGWLARPSSSLPVGALGAFFALSLMAGLCFASLLAHPPTWRVLGVVAAASAGGAALACTRALPDRLGLATLARIAILASAAYLAIRATGAPARLLWPWHWGAFQREVAHGLDALDGLWPYTGGAPRARLALLLALPATIVPASALVFWPGAWRAPARRALALGALIGMYAIAAMNEQHAAWRVQGVLLLGLLCVWGWAWRSLPVERGRAVAWLLVAGALALTGADALSSGAPLIDYHAWNPFGPAFPATSFNWNQTYGPLSWPNTTEQMVSVRSRAPYLWRATTLDRFDGVDFVRSSAQPPDAEQLSGAARHPGWVTRTTVTVRGFASTQLLSPGEVISVSIAGPHVPRLEPIASDGTVGVSARPESGVRYTITAYAPRPSAPEMARAPRTLPAAYLPYTQFELPHDGRRPVSAASPAGVKLIEASPYARVYALARRLASGAANTYQAAARIEAFLHVGFLYDLDPRRSAYPLVSFLLRERSGYCQQFSGAMTLLLRMDGIPARVAAGFTSGARDPAGGSFEVTAQDAHAWVEIYFAGIGWVPFDPTPARPATGSSDGLLARAAGGGSALALRHRARPTRTGAAAGLAASPRASAAGLGFGELLAIVIVLVLASVLALGLARRSRARGVARAFADDAEGAVRELTRALVRAGVPLAAGTTLAELEPRLARSHGADAGRYVRLLRERRFAPDPDRRSPGARDRRLLRRALCAGYGPKTRLRVLLALPPLRLRSRPPRRDRRRLRTV